MAGCGGTRSDRLRRNFGSILSFAPLLNAPLLILVHAGSAISALVLGVAQLARKKGTVSHRFTGWIWIALMTIVAASSFWIHDIRQFGAFSLIHALSLFTLAALPVAVLHARHGRAAQHRNAMIGLFVGALVIAGAFTLLPGRLMHEVVFGGIR
jgi:uncharacterized membrane protein